MPHMYKQEYSGTYFAIETEEGTTFLPSLDIGNLPEMESGTTYYADSNETEEDETLWESWCNQAQDYVQGFKIVSIERREGTLYRLSAPGYLDCTDWTPDADSPEFDDDTDDDTDI